MPGKPDIPEITNGFNDSSGGGNDGGVREGCFTLVLSFREGGHVLHHQQGLLRRDRVVIVLDTPVYRLFKIGTTQFSTSISQLQILRMNQVGFKMKWLPISNFIHTFV